MSEQVKDVIRVFVMTGPETSGITTTRKIVDGKPYYKGVVWDIFKEISRMPEIKRKYDFNFTFSKYGVNNYDQSIQDIHDNKYDMCIGGYISNSKREELVNFSSPLLIDAPCIFHYVSHNITDIFINVLKNITKSFIILIVLGILSGLALYYFTPSRKKNTNAKTSSEFLFRSIITGIFTFFGEAGYLSENSTTSIKGIIIVVVIMLISFIYLMFLQAEITSQIINRKQNKESTIDVIREKPVLGHEGYASARKMKSYGIRVKYIKGKKNDDLIDMYISNPEKYSGVVLTYCDGFPYKNLKNLHSTLNFGYEPLSIPIRTDKTELLDDINKSIMKLRSRGDLKDICYTYFGDVKNVPTCKLY